MTPRPLSLLCIALLACGPQARAPAERRPLSAPCDALDDTRCLLPWPSSTFTVADDASPTGLRVAVEARALPQRDSVAPLAGLDGFSVATPLLVGFPSKVDPALSGQRNAPGVRLFVASGPRFGDEVPVRLHVVDDSNSEAGLLIAYPQRPLAFGTDYVALVLDDVRPATGGAFAPTRPVAVSAGAVEPATDDERALFRYHAPARTLLSRAKLPASRVLRLWDFTTRSEASAVEPFLAMRALALDAVRDQALAVTVTETSSLLDGGLDVRGTVGGLPNFVADGGLSPEPVGTHAVPFRIALPGGVTGSLPVVLSGHGTGGTVNDTALEADLLGTGAARLNLEFPGWTRATVPGTFVGFDRVLSGSERSTARLAQALVDASALRAALGAQLGAAVVVATDAGVQFDLSRVAWVGSSLGGTLGFAHAQQEPGVAAAVLNVPGAGCTQFLLHAEQWQQLDVLFEASTPSRLDRALALAISQTSWDLIDGASWSARAGQGRKPLLIQESLGDVVLPNLGNELVAAASGAVHLSRVLVPVEGVSPADEAAGPSLTQYRVPAAVTDTGDVHAFWTKSTPAGVAARAQVVDFLRSVWAGAPVARPPAACQANATGCDFSSSP